MTNLPINFQQCFSTSMIQSLKYLLPSVSAEVTPVSLPYCIISPFIKAMFRFAQIYLYLCVCIISSRCVIRFITLEDLFTHHMVRIQNSSINTRIVLPFANQISSFPFSLLMLKLQYFGHLMQRANLLEKIPFLGNIEGRRRRGWQRMSWLDGIIPSMDMVWANSKR